MLHQLLHDRLPDEIEFQLPSCLKNNQYASIQRDDTYPPILNERQILTATYIANLFEPTPLDVLSDVHSYDTVTNIDSWLAQQYDELVGKPVGRTPSELRNMEEERFFEILETHTDVNDPILSTKIDLRGILSSNQQYHLTEEEEALPPQLLHKEDRTVYTFAMKSWHIILLKELDAQKLRAFLGFRPIDIVRKTLANTTQMARLIIRYPF
jgi:hypothetical protein